MEKHLETPVRRARLARELTQAAVAEQLGIDQGNYSRIERGDQATSPKVAKAIAEFLGVSIEQVLFPFSDAEN